MQDIIYKINEIKKNAINQMPEDLSSVKNWFTDKARSLEGQAITLRNDFREIIRQHKDGIWKADYTLNQLEVIRNDLKSIYDSLNTLNGFGELVSGYIQKLKDDIKPKAIQKLNDLLVDKNPALNKDALNECFAEVGNNLVNFVQSKELESKIEKHEQSLRNCLTEGKYLTIEDIKYKIPETLHDELQNLISTKLSGSSVTEENLSIEELDNKLNDLDSTLDALRVLGCEFSLVSESFNISTDAFGQISFSPVREPFAEIVVALKDLNVANPVEYAKDILAPLTNELENFYLQLISEDTTTPNADIFQVLHTSYVPPIMVITTDQRGGVQYTLPRYINAIHKALIELKENKDTENSNTQQIESYISQVKDKINKTASQWEQSIEMHLTDNDEDTFNAALRLI